MGNERETGGINKKSLAIINVLLLCVIFAGGQYAMLPCASDDSVDVTVTVTSPSLESYGASVIASSHVFLPQQVLGEPDGRGGWMFPRGWASIELEGAVGNCSDISIWAARRGWRSPTFRVYTSADGSTWTYIGRGKCASGSYTRYDFSGAFGDVKYIRVRRNSSRGWSFILLDAVRAKGGDA